MFLGLAIGYFQGSASFWSSVFGLLFGFGFLFVFWVFQGVGGGDVKLMGAAGTLLGSALTPVALVYTAFLGAFLAILMVIWRKDFWDRIRRLLRGIAFWIPDPAPSAPSAEPVDVPYGIAIAMGCLLAIFVGV